MGIRPPPPCLLSVLPWPGLRWPLPCTLVYRHLSASCSPTLALFWKGPCLTYTVPISFLSPLCPHVSILSCFSWASALGPSNTLLYPFLFTRLLALLLPPSPPPAFILTFLFLSLLSPGPYPYPNLSPRPWEIQVRAPLVAPRKLKQGVTTLSPLMRGQQGCLPV